MISQISIKIEDNVMNICGAGKERCQTKHNVIGTCGNKMKDDLHFFMVFCDSTIWSPNESLKGQ